jgi:hypothetical protein
LERATAAFLTPNPGDCRQHGVNKTELHWVEQRIKSPLSGLPGARKSAGVTTG